MPEEFKVYAQAIIDNAKTWPRHLKSGGLKLISGGTDNHLMLVDVTPLGSTGKIAETVLERCGITVNMNMIPFEQRKPLDPSGIRIGTPALTTRGMGTDEDEADWPMDAARHCKAPEDEGLLNQRSAARCPRCVPNSPFRPRHWKQYRDGRRPVLRQDVAAHVTEFIGWISMSESRILIADDNQANCELLEAYLAELDCEVAIAVDGQETLDKIESFQPDLILLDIMMPKLNGFEVCKKIKEDPVHQRIMVLMVTALNELGDIERAVSSRYRRLPVQAGAEDRIAEARPEHVATQGCGRRGRAVCGATSRTWKTTKAARRRRARFVADVAPRGSRPARKPPWRRASSLSVKWKLLPARQDACPHEPLARPPTSFLLPFSHLVEYPFRTALKKARWCQPHIQVKKWCEG